jgi:hypothetical protein
MKIVKQTMIIISLAISSLVACNASKTYEQAANDKFDTEVQYTFNSDSTYVICYNKDEGSIKNPRTQTSYFIYDVGKSKILKEGSGENLVLSFESDTEVKITQIPGVMRQGETRDDYSKVYNVKTGELKDF